MKKDIHPKYKDFEIKIGTESFMTKSAGKDSRILVEVDFRKHPAWTKKSVGYVNQSNRNISDFNKKFAGLGLGSKSK